MKFERAYIDEINESIDDLMKKRCRFIYEVNKNGNYKDFGCNVASEFYRDVLCISNKLAHYFIRLAWFANECEKIDPGWVWDLPWHKFFLIAGINDAKVVCEMKDRIIKASYKETIDISKEFLCKYKNLDD